MYSLSLANCARKNKIRDFSLRSASLAFGCFFAISLQSDGWKGNRYCLSDEINNINRKNYEQKEKKIPKEPDLQ